MPDHVHMMISIPPKYVVSQVIGYIKGKSAIHLARVYGEKKRNFVGQHFWARGYFVSTVGRDEAVIREYIRKPPPTAALSGPIPKAPGFAGGYLPGLLAITGVNAWFHQTRLSCLSVRAHAPSSW
jgi:hypothetical protein